MSDWTSTAPSAATGFDENICKSLITEVESCITLFDTFYKQIGTVQDNRDLRGKIGSTKTKGTDATTRLQAQLGQPVKQAQLSLQPRSLHTWNTTNLLESITLTSEKAENQAAARRALAQQAQDVINRFADASKKVGQRESEVVRVMRQSLDTGKSAKEVAKILQIDNIQLTERDVDQALIEERNAESQAILEATKGLKEAADDIKEQLQQDGVKLETTEKSTINADKDVEKGKEETQKASEYLCAARWKMFLIIGIIIAVVAVIAIVAGVLGSRSNQAPVAPVEPPVAVPVAPPV